MTKASPIGVFDSGIGGLTVLRALMRHLPNESFIYFGDTARVPYGNKSHDTVLRFSRENVSFLLDQGVKCVVVACNTASAEAVPVVRDEVAVPVLGVIEPGVRAAVRESKTGRIGIIGTAATIRSGAYQRGVEEALPEASVLATACPLFVPLVEEGWVDNDITLRIAETYLAPYREADIDALVLGCTHYPLLAETIGRTVGDGVTLVDSAVETAREVAEVLNARDMLSNATDAEFTIYLSDIAPNFQDIGERILGRPIQKLQLLSV